MKALSYSPMPVILFVLLVAAGFVGRIDAAVYNLHLVTDNVPDYTDIESFVESVTGHLDTPQGKLRFALGPSEAVRRRWPVSSR